MYGSLFIGGPLQLYVEQKQTAEQIQIQLLEFLQRSAFEISDHPVNSLLSDIIY